MVSAESFNVGSHGSSFRGDNVDHLQHNRSYTFPILGSLLSVELLENIRDGGLSGSNEECRMACLSSRTLSRAALIVSCSTSSVDIAAFNPTPTPIEGFSQQGGPSFAPFA